MLSRVADSMFWMNRYMERAEGLLRVLLTNYVLSLDKGPYGVHSWRPVLETFGNLSDEADRIFICQHLAISYSEPLKQQFSSQHY